MLVERLSAFAGYGVGLEFNPDPYFPYIDHIADGVMLLADGSIMGVLQMAGSPFGLVTNKERNGYKRRWVAFLNAVADENVEIHAHLVKHDASLPEDRTARSPSFFGGSFLETYHAGVAEDLSAIDWFLTVRVKPRAMALSGVEQVLAPVLQLAGFKRRKKTVDQAMETQLEDAMRLAMGTLAPCLPVRLGTQEVQSQEEDGEPLFYSEIAEFLYLLRTTQFSPQPMADVLGFLGAGISAVEVKALPTASIIQIDHAAGGGPATQTFAAVVGLVAYPRKIDQSRFDDIMKLPCRFVMTTAIRFESRAESQDRLVLLENRLRAAGSRAKEDLKALDDAINEIAGGRSESGVSRWSLVLHSGDRSELDTLVSTARTVIANAGAKAWVERKGMLSAFIAQLPGAPAGTWIRPARCNTRQISVLASLNGYPRGAARARWGRHLLRLTTAAGTAFDHDLFVGDVGHTPIIGPNGEGKCLAKGTPVMMHDGIVVPVEDVRVGDLLMGPDSQPRRVVSLARGRQEMFTITPKRGSSYTVNRSHILSLKTCSGSMKNCHMLPAGSVVNLTVDEYLGKPSSWRNCVMGWRAPVDFPDAKTVFPMPPYLLGVWLGDGSSWRPEVCTGDAEIKEYLANYVAEHDLKLTVRPNSANSEIYKVAGKSRRTGNPFGEALAALDLLQNKHVPHEYKTSLRADRLALLAGLIDTDGYWSGKGFYLTLKSERLIDDVIFVARSLGFAAFKYPIQKTCYNNQVVGDYWQCTINGPVETIPCKVPRKQASPRRINKNPLLTGIRSVESVGEGDYYGFTLEGPDRLFLLGDFTVTHNTVVIGALISAVDGLICDTAGTNRKPGTQILFDVDQSNHNTIAMLGGRYSVITHGHSGIAPLRGLSGTPHDRAFIRNLIAGLVQTDGAPPPTKAEREGIREGVDFVFDHMAPEERSFETIRSFMRFDDNGAGDRLEPWCWGHERGWVFDGPQHEIDYNVRLAGTDLTRIMDDAAIMPPLAFTLLWLASEVMDGRRVVVWCEEAPAYMPTPAFAKAFKGIALRARKRNASFNAIAQDPADLLNNEAGYALIKQARQFILFRNEKAEPETYVKRMNVTPAVFKAITEDMYTLPYRSFAVVRQDRQSGVFKFDLSHMPDHLNILSGTPQRVELLQDCFKQCDGDLPKSFAMFSARIHEASA